MPSISVVMPCHNRAYDLSRTLEAYDKQNVDEPFELIAIDDASVDDTYELLNSYRPEHYSLQVELQEKNLGPAAARNRGILASRSPLILFTGDDIVPHPNLIRGHLAAHRFYRGKEIAVLGKVMWPDDLPVNTLMTHIDGVGAQQFSYHYFLDGLQYDYRHLYTANVSLKKEFLMSQDRLFDTDFQYAAFEDVELSYRLAKNGLRIIYSSHLTGFHYHYHDIWTFSERMYRVGLMAHLMMQKHPKTRRRILGRKWPLRIVKWQLMKPFHPNSMDTTQNLENQLLHFSSSFEWRAHPYLDDLYLKLLRYFFIKGLIYGMYGKRQEANIVNNLCAEELLVPLKKNFSEESNYLEKAPATAL
jgi:glycosyltransferase involved in cell wall biosynthesis